MRRRLMCAVALLGSTLLAQEPQTPRFRVSVDAVRIDAVVTDKKNDVVRDLTAEDFEILQDGKPQKVTFAQFVPVAVRASAARSAGAALPAGRTLPGSPDQRRTFAIVVDDLGLSFEGMYYVRKGLRRFIDTALLPTDLVLLVRTGEARSLLQPLTNDREALRAAVDGLRYNMASRKGISPSGDIIQGPHGPEIEAAVNDVQRIASIQGTVAALNLVVRAARDLPGRKAVILASEGFTVHLKPGEAMLSPAKDDTTRALTDIDNVIDQATRSGVVIYATNGAGLLGGGPRASDDFHQTSEVRDPFASSEYKGGGEAMAGELRHLSSGRLDDINGEQAGLEYLTERTGGFAVRSNDQALAMTRIRDDVRGYYVIGYQPDPTTFAREGQSVRRHSIAVNVKRPGVRVRTRKEFIGVSDEAAPAPPTPAQQLVLAARSPFVETTIPVQATNLAGYAPGRGLFVRTVLHLDPHALTFAGDANNARTATVDLVGLVIDNDGVQVDTIATGFNVSLPNAADETMKDGIIYVARVPIKKPGGYQLRYAVRDRHSGAVGSGGGFVNVPDIMRGTFALSGIVLRAGKHTWLRGTLDSDGFSLPAADALRVYAPGSELSYMYEVYNAGTGVQTAATLWRGIEQIKVQLPDPVMTPSAGGPLVVSGGMTLPDSLPAGTYVLQLTATTANPKQPKKPRAALQRISFDVSK